MKVVHWAMGNGSGLHRVAESFAQGEQKLGIDSQVVDPAWQKKELWVYDADINVCHTDLPEEVKRKGKPVVWVSHGTPEHVFKTAVEQMAQGYGHRDAWALAQHWLRVADATVTFWPRHQWLWKSICDKRTMVKLVPMGVDKDFWKPVESRGKFIGRPSVFTSENCHDIKWPLDLFFAWHLVWEKVMEARLHAAYVPFDMHRYFFPLINRNSVSHTGFIQAGAMNHQDLRNAFVSTNYYIGLVRYGDLNKVSLEANACGATTISYEGNPYSDYWIQEGDQRRIAEQIADILLGKVEKRKKDEVPTVDEQAKVMKEEVYDKL